MKTSNKNNRDNRMGWVLITEECKKAGDKKVYFTEYEICSEARISGVLDYDKGVLLCALLQEMNPKGLYAYTIRVKHAEKEYKFDENNYSKEGYFFKNGLIGELMALFSVYFQARFYLKATASGELTSKSIKLRRENEFQYKKPGRFLNFEMFSEQKRNWAYGDGLKLFLDTIRTLDQKYHQFFAEPEKDVIERWLENRKIRQRFVTFLQNYSKGFFKRGKRKAKHCYIKKSELTNYAKRIYDARSAYLHSGKPMFLSVDMKMEGAKYWDLDPSLGMMVDRKRFAANEKLPRTRWFERIVNYCLKNFIEEKRN